MTCVQISELNWVDYVSFAGVAFSGPARLDYQLQRERVPTRLLQRFSLRRVPLSRVTTGGKSDPDGPCL